MEGMIPGSGKDDHAHEAGKTTVTVSITNSLMAAVSCEALEKRCSLSEVVDLALHTYLAIREVVDHRRFGRPGETDPS